MIAWLALMIGNSRLHWAWFDNDHLRQSWDTPHASEDALANSSQASVLESLTASLSHPCPFSFPSSPKDWPSLAIASVVPRQTQYWQTYPQARVLTLGQIPLSNLYSTLGIDRGLAALGAWHHYRCPVLVIDGGTALTFTGVDQTGALVGGAILPGFRLQLRSLHHHTAALPDTVTPQLPTLSRWQHNTPDAIRSGVWHGLVAAIQDFVTDWQRQFPDSVIVFTGGDGQRLHQALSSSGSNRTVEARDGVFDSDSGNVLTHEGPARSTKKSRRSLLYDPHVVFRGMAIARSNCI